MGNHQIKIEVKRTPRRNRQADKGDRGDDQINHNGEGQPRRGDTSRLLWKRGAGSYQGSIAPVVKPTNTIKRVDLGRCNASARSLLKKYRIKSGRPPRRPTIPAHKASGQFH